MIWISYDELISSYGNQNKTKNNKSMFIFMGYILLFDSI